MKTYHKDLGIPDYIKIPDSVLNLIYTDHAVRRFKERIRGRIPESIKVTKKKVIEVTMKTKTKISLLVVRTQFNKRHDISLVINPDFKKHTGVVLTVWLNHKKDNHRTLKKRKYDTTNLRQIPESSRSGSKRNLKSKA